MGLSMGEGGNDYGGKWDWACELAGLNIIWDLCVPDKCNNYIDLALYFVNHVCHNFSQN